MDTYFQHANKLAHQNASDLSRYAVEIAVRATGLPEMIDTFYKANASDIHIAMSLVLFALSCSSLFVCVGAEVRQLRQLARDLEKRAYTAESRLEDAEETIKSLRTTGYTLATARVTIAALRKAARERKSVAVKALMDEKETLIFENKRLERIADRQLLGQESTVLEAFKLLDNIRSICDDDQSRAAAKVSMMKMALGDALRGDDGSEPRCEFDPDFKPSKTVKRPRSR